MPRNNTKILVRRQSSLKQTGSEVESVAQAGSQLLQASFSFNCRCRMGSSFLFSSPPPPAQQFSKGTSMQAAFPHLLWTAVTEAGLLPSIGSGKSQGGGSEADLRRQQDFQGLLASLLMQQTCCKGVKGVTLRPALLLPLRCRGRVFCRRSGEGALLLSRLFPLLKFLFCSFPAVATNQLCAFCRQQGWLRTVSDLQAMAWCGSGAPATRTAWLSGDGSSPSAIQGSLTLPVCVWEQKFLLQHLHCQCSSVSGVLQLCSGRAGRCGYTDPGPAPGHRKLGLVLALLCSAEQFFFCVFLKHNVPSWAG